MAVRRRMIAVLGASLLLPELSHALTVGRINVQSNLGEPFRAELVVSDLGSLSANDIKATLANESDFTQLGINRSGYAGALSFSVRPDGSRAIISIRSRQPLNDPFLELVVRISAGNNVRLQQLTALINPPVVRTPAQLPNLPTDTNRTPVTTLNNNNVQPRHKEQALIPILSEPPPLIVPAEPAAPLMTPTERATAPRYVVKSNDSLWKIASDLQKERSESVGTLMKQIQRLNSNAFINGDASQLKAGATLVLPKGEEQQASLTQDVAPLDTPPPPAIKPKKITAPPVATPTLKRGALPTPEMTLVAPTRQGMAQGNSTLTGRSSGVQPLSRDLATKVGNARQKTASLRREVIELDAQVTANDQKIAMQNAKLAELEQRLKARKEAKKRLIMNKTPVVALTATGLMGALLNSPEAHAAPEQAAQAANSGSAMWMIIVAVIVVVGAIAAFVMKGKKKPTTPPTAQPSARPAPKPARPVSRPEDTAAKAPEAKPAEKPAAVVAPVAEPVVAKEKPMVTETVDPITEAQAFISRERYPQAVGLLTKAIAVEPKRSDLLLLLLDVYARQDDVTAFEIELVKLEALNDADAIRLAHQLRADLTPIAEESSSEDLLTFTPSTPAAPVEEKAPTTPPIDHQPLDFSLEKPINDGTSPALELDQNDDRAFTLDTADTVEPVAKVEPVSTDNLDALAELEDEFRTSGIRPALDLSEEPLTALDLELPAAPAPTSTDDEPAKLDFDIDGSFDLADDAPALKSGTPDNLSAGFDDLDFSLPSDEQLKPVPNTEALSIEQLEAASSNAAMDSQADHFDAMLDQPSTDVSSDGSLSGQLASEFSFLNEQDDQQVNLDLARSYADLGELQSARELLDDVVAHGNTAQQDDARDLLSKLAS